MLAWLKDHGVRQVVLAGTVARPSLLSLRPDAAGVKLLARIGRAAFTGGLCIPAIATVPSRIKAPDPLDVARHSADLLAAMMQELHGGTWFATVDHESGFVLIRPKNGGAA